MKRVTKNGGIFAAASALLIVSVMLVTGCTGGITGEEPYTPPAGMGAIRLNFNKNVTRTINADTVIDDFEKFEFIFTDSTSGVPDTPIEILKANKSKPIALTPENYHLEILAYMTTTPGESPAASWSSAASGTYNIIVTANSTTTYPYPVTLKGIADDTGFGTFEWDIDTSELSGIPTTAIIDITPIGGTGFYQFDLINTYDLNDSEDILSGYYYVDFTFEVDNSTTPITFRQILHIFNNMISKFYYKLEDDYFVITKTQFKTSSWEYEDSGTVIELEDSASDPIAEKAIITLTSTTSSETITISNIGEFTTTDWYCAFKGTDISSSLALTGSDSEILTITRGVAPFNQAGTYFITVIGNDGEAPTSISFIVVIESGTTTSIDISGNNYGTIDETNNVITLISGNNDDEVITVNNAANFTLIEWAGKDGSESTLTGLAATDEGSGLLDTLTITEGTAPFDNDDTYTITVTATDSDGMKIVFTFSVVIEP